MIDTDKYEGHMQDYYFEGSNFELEYLIMYDGDDNAIAMLHSYDKRLMGGVPFLSSTIEIMVDAPLLLAEVKRLQMYKKAWDKLYEYHNDETELGWVMQELMDKTMKEEEE